MFNGLRIRTCAICRRRDSAGTAGLYRGENAGGVMLSDTLDRVFQQVSLGFAYEPDISAWGKAEYWASIKDMAAQARPDGKVHGDCDDFALMCRTALDAQCIDNHLVYCQVETGSYHLVCEVRGWILDCRQRSVVGRDLLPYKWISRSGTKAGQPWHYIA